MYDYHIATKYSLSSGRWNRKLSLTGGILF